MSITLYELGPTRSARCRWALLEAELPFESRGNEPAIIGSDELRKIHPLGKLPAALIDGEALFESAAIVAAVADRVPEKRLIAPAGSWDRALHDQWVFFALTEMEPWVWSSELNTLDFVLSATERVPAIIEQNDRFFKKSAAVLDRHLGDHDFLVADRFTAADIIVGYTVAFGEEQGLLADFDHLGRYLDRLSARPHCTLAR